MEKGGLGFDDIMSTELRLGLPGATCTSSTEKNTSKKRVFSEVAEDNDENNLMITGDRKIQKKTQVVGWPPVCSYRKNIVQNKNEVSDSAKVFYVKVSMDGAPYLRKIDLSVYTRYSDLVVAFEKLFGCSGCIGNDSDGSEEYVSIYEDKDGDWMLVGDVPWTMFTESCKRLRIMKRSDAKCYGLQS